MSSAEWLVAALGVAAVVWVNWYFFAARQPAAVAVARGDGPDEVVVNVNGGYDPAVIRVKAGRPLRLIFDRQEENSCSEEIVLSDFGIRKFLPAFRRTAVDVTPATPGRYSITCGMSMLHGTIIAE